MRNPTGHPSPDSPENDAPSLRERLITKSIGILECEGLSALTLRAAARAAGVSHMAPYRHFSDKDDLLAAVAAWGFTELTTGMRRAAGVAKTEREQLDAIGRAYLTFARRSPALYRLMFGPLITDKSRHPELQQAGAAAFECCAAAVRAVLLASSPTPTSDIEPATIATWAVIHGLASLLNDGRIALPPGAASEEEVITGVFRVYGRLFDAPPQRPTSIT